MSPEELRREKIRQSRLKRKQKLGYLNSPETRAKQRAALLGKAPWNKGKTGVQTSTRRGVPLPQSVREKIRNTLTGKSLPESQRLAISKALKGKPGHNKGKPQSDEHKRKISDALKGIVFSEERKINISKALTGRKLSPEHKAGSSKGFYKKGHTPDNPIKPGEHRGLATEIKKGDTGPKSIAWIKDRSKLSDRSGRASPAYFEWAKHVKKRDLKKCRLADETCTKKIEVHHILPWRKYKHRRFDVDNGITLCTRHHPKGKREMEMAPMFFNMILSSIVKQN